MTMRYTNLRFIIITIIIILLVDYTAISNPTDKLLSAVQLLMSDDTGCQIRSSTNTKLNRCKYANCGTNSRCI